MRVFRQVRPVVLALVAAFALALPAAAQTFPALSGRVVDEAGVLDAGVRAALVEKLAALEAQTTDQLVVATVRSLQGYAIEDYANRLFRHWGLGQKQKNNGVLLLVAPTERKVRIEVGYGLEGTLTDAVAKLIIEQSIVPRFRASDFPGGTVRGTDDIVEVLTGDAARWQRRAALPANSHVHDMGVIELPPALGYVVLAVVFGVGGLMAALAVYLVVFLLVRFLIFVHVLPQRKNRHGVWLRLNSFDDDLYDRRGRRVSGHAYASGSSSSSDSFSGGGGSSGGGGASGSW